MRRWILVVMAGALLAGGLVAATDGPRPLTEMAATDRYCGQDGGLYGGGLNQPPERHWQAACLEAARIQPLDRAGQPSVEGRIGFVSVGMADSREDWAAFRALAEQDPSRAPRVVLVDGAQSGRDAEAWARSGGRGDAWRVLAGRVRRAGLTPKQVQVAWVLQALSSPARQGEFPRHAQRLQHDLTVLVRQLRARYPNLRLCYLSSRGYAGYATGRHRPEPYAYEAAFGVRWLIQAQLRRDPPLSWEGGEAPLLLWGPYLWADGPTPRSDGLSWQREDFADDGAEPSLSGRYKVGRTLLEFLKTDPTARRWFVGE